MLIIIALMFFVRRAARNNNKPPLSSSTATIKGHELGGSVHTIDNPLSAAVPAPLSPSLRVWRRTCDNDDVWFVHVVTGVSAWSAPEDQILDDDDKDTQALAPSLLRIWKRVTDGTDSWLVNSVTGESAWEGTVNSEEIMIEEN